MRTINPAKHARPRALVGAAAIALAAAHLVGWGAVPGDASGRVAKKSASKKSAFPGAGSLGYRDLRLGDRGGDVKTLNWALRSQALGAPYHGTFDTQTDVAVRALQAGAGIASDGVVRRDTRKAIATGMASQAATWYGPGLYGNRTACGVKLTKKTVGVAHRTLPCGTRVAFANRGRWVRARVIDRGPFRRGHQWDLTRRLAKRLGLIKLGSAPVKTGVAP